MQVAKKKEEETRAAREAANAASEVSPSGLVSMPLRPPQPYGVWQGCIVDGVAKLREYLVENWPGSSREYHWKPALCF